MQSFLPNSYLALPVLRLYGWHGDSLVKPAQVSSDSQGRQFQQEAVQVCKEAYPQITWCHVFSYIQNWTELLPVSELSNFF